MTNQSTCNKTIIEKSYEKIIIGLIIALCLCLIVFVSGVVLVAHKWDGLLRLDSDDIVCVDMSVYKSEIVATEPDIENKNS